MGSCHSAHLLYSNNNINNKECFICWKDTEEIYIKCRACKIILHENCGDRYFGLSTVKSCPYCHRKKYLFLYKYEETTILN